MQEKDRHIAQYEHAHENKLEPFIFHFPLIIGPKSLKEPCFSEYSGSNSVDQSELNTSNR